MDGQWLSNYEPKGDKDNEQTPLKRQKIGSNESLQHLRVRFHVNDMISATVVFCFASWNKQDIKGFDYCLVRGTKGSWEKIFQWLEHRAGNNISRRPIQFHDVLLAGILADWIDRQEKGRKGSSVEFKFAPPLIVRGKGIDEICCTFPHADFYDLCQGIDREVSVGLSKPYTLMP